MDSTIIAAIITGAATVLAAVIGLQFWRRWRFIEAPKARNRELNTENSSAESRIVYYRGVAHRFLNFGGKHCRIERLDGSPSFLGLTHEMFHDIEQKRRITRDSIVLRATVE